MGQAIYHLLDHTADLRVRLEADSLEGLFQSALDAIRELAYEGRPLAPGPRQQTVAITEDASDLGEALVLFCNDVLYEVAVRGLVPWRLVSFTWAAGSLEAQVEATPPPLGVAPERELKAATYGGLEIAEQDGHWLAVLVFDV